MTEEIWKPIPGYEGLYEISNKCRVKSLPKFVIRDKVGVKNYPETIIKPNNSNRVRLFKDKKSKYLCIKKLFMLVFENITVKRMKYDSLTFDSGKVILTSQRNIVAKAKLKSKTKKCKLTGVSLSTSKGSPPFMSSITIHQRNIYLGRFYSEQEAHDIYLKAAKYNYLYQGVPKLFREILRTVA